MLNRYKNISVPNYFIQTFQNDNSTIIIRFQEKSTIVSYEHNDITISAYLTNDIFSMPVAVIDGVVHSYISMESLYNDIPEDDENFKILKDNITELYSSTEVLKYINEFQNDMVVEYNTESAKLSPLFVLCSNMDVIDIMGIRFKDGAIVVALDIEQNVLNYAVQTKNHYGDKDGDMLCLVYNKEEVQVYLKDNSERFTRYVADELGSVIETSDEDDIMFNLSMKDYNTDILKLMRDKVQEPDFIKNLNKAMYWLDR